MFPYFYLFGRMIPTYALMALLGCFACGILLCKEIRKRKMDDNDAIVFLLIVAIGVLIGGHILYGITNMQHWHEIFKASGFMDLINKIFVLFSGSVFYGGLFGGIFAGFLAIKLMKLNMEIYADTMAYLAPLFHGIARIGCFLGGCCYGIECELGFTVNGNTLVPSINGVSRFPIQLLEAFCNFALCFVLWYLYKKHKLSGKLFYIYLSSYAIIRFFDEFLRGDEIRGFVFGLSTSQFISIILEITVVVILIVTNLKKRRKTDV